MTDNTENVAPWKVPTAADVARTFHEVYEDLAQAYGWNTQEKCRVPFDDLPFENRALMIEVVRVTVCERWPLIGALSNLSRVRADILALAGEMETDLRALHPCQGENCGGCAHARDAARLRNLVSYLSDTVSNQ